jgi:hypothetical protein
MLPDQMHNAYSAAGLTEHCSEPICERPIKLSREQFKAVIEHDSWDTWGQ